MSSIGSRGSVEVRKPELAYVMAALSTVYYYLAGKDFFDVPHESSSSHKL